MWGMALVAMVWATPAYEVEHDQRRCAAPLCGGFWVREVGQPTTTCADGSVADACYVAEIDWSRGLISPGRQRRVTDAAYRDAARIRGRLRTRPVMGVDIGVLMARDGWVTTPP